MPNEPPSATRCKLAAGYGLLGHSFSLTSAGGHDAPHEALIVTGDRCWHGPTPSDALLRQVLAVSNCVLFFQHLRELLIVEVLEEARDCQRTDGKLQVGGFHTSSSGLCGVWE